MNGFDDFHILLYIYMYMYDEDVLFYVLCFSRVFFVVACFAFSLHFLELLGMKITPLRPGFFNFKNRVMSRWDSRVFFW